ncbi:MAG: Rrf2 family transcriptional regulator [bacterium]
MKITYKGDYAIKSLLYLAARYIRENGTDSYSQIHEISKDQDIPEKFLEQILLTLKNAGFVKSLRGKNGGYTIAKKPESIKLGEIIRLIDGPLAPIACVSRSAYQSCDFEARCVLKPIWENVNEAISNIVDNISFRNLVEMEQARKKKSVEQFVYQI